MRRDIIERYKIKNEETLKALLRLLLNSTSYSISKLYNTLKSLGYGIGKTTLQHYLGYIESSYFIFSVPIFSYKIKDQMQYARKVYFIDNSFINTISTRFSKNYGRLYENVVAVSLFKKYHGNVYYWKNAQKEEVDFIVKDDFKVNQIIQVCYDISDFSTKEREVRALLKASKELKCKDLMVITEDYEKEERVEWFGIKRKIKFIPLWKWLLKLD
jgi:predicted AAA+ superfamily ATPase